MSYLEEQMYFAVGMLALAVCLPCLFFQVPHRAGFWVALDEFVSVVQGQLRKKVKFHVAKQKINK